MPASTFGVNLDNSNFQEGSMLFGNNGTGQMGHVIQNSQNNELDKKAWVPDNKATECKKCRKEFTFFYRKHHCRLCGHVFCNACTIIRTMQGEKEMRVCNQCESEYNNLVKSLEGKKNLFNNRNERDNSFKDNQQQIGTASKAPKNVKWKQEYGEEVEENPDEVVQRTNNEEEVKLEEQLRQQKIILKEAEYPGTIIDYLKDQEHEQSERTFSGMHNQFSGGAKKEYNVKQALKEFSIYHIRQIVNDIMVKRSIDQEKWGIKLFDFVRTAVEQVQPSSRRLNDTMDFLHFIKIKVINYIDNSKSGYINGIVMSKNIADKRMNTQIQNPKILLLDKSINTSQAGESSLQTIIDQGNDWNAIIKHRLTQFKPNIIIVEQDVSYQILDELRQEGITVITDMPKNKMKRIQRFTQTVIAPSYNVLTNQFKFGSCNIFQVEDPYNGNQMMYGGFDFNIAKEALLVSNDRTLLYFIGTNPALGCTILLSGNLQFEKEELKNVKEGLKEMLKLARNIILERSFLYQMNCKIPYPFTEAGLINAAESPFLITKNIENRSSLVINKVIMKKGNAQMPSQNPTILQTGNNLTSGNQNNVTQTGQIPNPDISMQIDTLGITMSKVTTEQLKVNETYVKRNIDSICDCPKKEKYNFYVKKDPKIDKNDGECTFGVFLKKTAAYFISENCCIVCKEPNSRHFIQYYHKQGCLELQYEPKTNLGQSRMVHGENLMWGECQICKKQVTEDIIMSPTLYEYSKARVIEQFFYNGDNLFNSNPSCGHKSLKDIQWNFILLGSIQISMTYIPQDVYSIKMIQPKKEDTKELYALEISKKQEAMRHYCENAYFDIKKKMKGLLEFVQTQRDLFIPQDFEKLSKYENHLCLIIDPLDTIISSLSPSIDSTKTSISQGNTFEQDLTNTWNELTKAIYEIKNIFEATFLERKIIVNFMTYAKILDEVSNVTCLQLALLKMRHHKQQKNEGSINVLQSQDPTEMSRLQIESDSNQHSVEYSKFGTLGAGANPFGFTPVRKNSHTVDISNDAAPQSNSQNAFNMQQLFLDEFILQTDLNVTQTPIINITQQNITLTGKFNQPQYQFNPLENAKKMVKSNVDLMLKMLKDKLENIHDHIYANVSKIVIEEEEKEQLESSLTRDKNNHHLDGSFNQTLNPKNNAGLVQQPVYDPNQSIVEPEHDLSDINYIGFINMPLGSDNIHIPLGDNNIGQILSYALSSNIYKEAMIKQNYMDIQSKIKAPTAKRVNLNGTMTQDAVNNQPNMRDSITGNTATIINPTINTPTIGNFTQQSQNYSDEYTKLYGKDDVFNYDLSPHQIETELLSGEKLSFIIKFSTEHKDLTLKIEKNNQQTKLLVTSMQFQTGQYEHIDSKDSKKQGLSTTASDSKQKKEILKKNDLQERVAPNISKEYMDLSNPFLCQMIKDLDTSIKILNCGYFLGNLLPNKNESPLRNGVMTEEYKNDQFTMEAVQSQHLMSNGIISQSQTMEIQNATINATNAVTRDSISMMQPKKSPQISSTQNLPVTPSLLPPSSPMIDEFCFIKSPILIDRISQLKSELQIPKVEYELKIFFAKKFEALRRFYCGPQYDFIQSLIKTIEWTTVTGGKTKSKFYRSFDDKYVFKEIKKNEFNWFIDFAPQYFDYLCKSFFHNYPCALCKILGAFKIKILKYKNNKEQPKIVKKYIYITENLNFGIKQEDEHQIVRYDLKGSTLNRFVKDQYTGKNSMPVRRVLHDNNFQLEQMGRPLPIRYTINRILHICINNDTLFLSKSNIVDYSLLTIIDKKRKQVRFGIIDYMQQYTLDKIFECKFKRMMNGGEVPTIVEPDKYKFRFKKAMKRYFIGMVVQEEKKQLESGGDMHEIQERHDEEDELNQTMNQKNMTMLNESMAHYTSSQKNIPEASENTHNMLASLQQ